MVLVVGCSAISAVKRAGLRYVLLFQCSHDLRNVPSTKRSESMTSSRSVCRSFLAVCAIGVSACLVETALAGDPPPENVAAVVEIEKAAEGEALYFAVVLDQPGDMKVKWGWRERRSESSQPQPADIAELYSVPVWMCPAYREDVPTHYQKTPSSLNFMGRCRPLDGMDLHLRYITKDGSWNELPLHLDLAGAAQAADVEVLKQRWAQGPNGVVCEVSAIRRRLRRLSGLCSTTNPVAVRPGEPPRTSIPAAGSSSNPRRAAL